MTCATGLPAAAEFLRGTAFAALTSADLTLQREAALGVLEGADARATREWKNPTSNASGKVESLGNYQSEDNLHCRRLKFSTQAKGIESQMSFPACRGPDGEWFIASGKKLTQVR